MNAVSSERREAAPVSTRAAVVSVFVFLVVATLLLSWAKWVPYWHKLFAVAATHTLGASILTGRAQVAPAPSLQAGLDYGIAYFRSIWAALVAGVVVAAGVEALVPQHWLLKLMASGGRTRRALIGGLLAMPGFM